MGDTLKRVFRILGIAMAITTIFLFAFMYVNAAFDIVKNATVLNVLAYIKEYACLATVGVVVLSFAFDKGLITFIIFAVVIAIIVIFGFFPSVADKIIYVIR